MLIAMTFHSAPRHIRGIPGLRQVKSKSSRKRWKDGDGYIYEWDGFHQELEKYDKTGKHLGAFNHDTGTQIKEPQKNRRIEP